MGVLHDTLKSLKTSSGPHAYLEIVTSEMITRAHEARSHYPQLLAVCAGRTPVPF